MMVIAATEWPEATVAVAAIALVGSIVVVVVWQLLATWRARMSGSREVAFQKLAEHATEVQQRNALALEQLLSEVRTVRDRTAELERILREVE